MKKFIKFIVAFSIFLLSAWKLKSELSAINFKDVFQIVENRSLASIATLILVSFLGVWILSLYDVVLIRSQKLKVPILKTMKMSWIINSLNTLIGFGGVIGSTIRYNYFQGFTETDEEKSILKKNISLLLLSMLTGIGALSFLVVANVFSADYLLAKKPILKVGLYILAGLLPIFLAITTIKAPVPTDRWVTFKYTCVSVIDYMFVGLVMFLSLRFVDVNVDFWQMESVFIIAAIAGLISMVPGGLGAFDVVFLLGMTHQFGLERGPVLLALVFYRLTYYILPFFLGLILSISEMQLILKEKLNEKDNVIIFTKEFGTIFIDVTKRRVQTMIQWIMVSVFVIGSFFLTQDAMVGLFSIGPNDKSYRLVLFNVMYVLAAFYMIPNYVGLFYKSKEAFRNLLILIVIGVLCQIVLFDHLYFIEGFIISGIFASVLFLSRKNFTTYLTIRYRREKVVWAFTFFMVYLIHLIIIETSGDYDPQMVRAFYISFVLISLVWFLYLWGNRYRLRHKYTFATLANENKMSGKREDFEALLVNYEGSNLANLGFLPSNAVLVDQDLEVGLIYLECSYYILVLGDPIGKVENFFPFFKEVHDYATKVGKEIIVYQTTTENIHIYTELNYSLFNLGEEAEVDVESFKITGNKGKVFRQLLNKQSNEELSFQIEPTTHALIEELRPISDVWLNGRKEMSFSLGNFNETYLMKQDIATIRTKEGRAIAFASLMPAYIDGKMSVDLIRWEEHDAIPMMDLLYLNLILWAQEENYEVFNLGMAPLSSSFEKTNTFLTTIITSVYQNSSSLYSFKGLRNYKSKFKPNWYPRYLVYPKRLLISQAFIQSYKAIHPKNKATEVKTIRL